MATPSISNTLVDGQTIQPGPLNQNFSDIVTGLGSGGWDITIGALTVAGAMTINGNATLGNAASDTITLSGTVNSDIVPASASTYNIGTASLPWKQITIGGTLASNTSAITNTIYANGIIRSWGSVGSMATVLAGFNISDCARVSTGIFSITFANGFSDNIYAAFGTPETTTVANLTTIRSTASVRFITNYASGPILNDIGFGYVVFG